LGYQLGTFWDSPFSSWDSGDIVPSVREEKTMAGTTKESPIMVAIYARVSTRDQDTDLQLRELHTYVERRGWTIAAEHVDQGVSGTKERRPALDKLMHEARRQKFRAVVVWKFDRFARSVRHLVTALGEFRELGIDFVSITEAIDTSTPLGRAMFAIVGAIAEFERELIRERVVAGVAKAKATGKRLGRPRAVLDLTTVRARLEAGASLRAVARDLKVHHVTLARALERDPGAKSPPERASPDRAAIAT
jgi:DNA invertase Pin-like site-specific DNA recombinase